MKTEYLDVFRELQAISTIAPDKTPEEVCHKYFAKIEAEKAFKRKMSLLGKNSEIELKPRETNPLDGYIGQSYRKWKVERLPPEDFWKKFVKGLLPFGIQDEVDTFTNHTISASSISQLVKMLAGREKGRPCELAINPRLITTEINLRYAKAAKFKMGDAEDIIYAAYGFSKSNYGKIVKKTLALQSLRSLLQQGLSPLLKKQQLPSFDIPLSEDEIKTVVNCALQNMLTNYRI